MTATSSDWFGDQEAKPAPEPLRRVQSFINTIDRESGQDRFAKLEDAQPWLVDNHLLAPTATAGADDLRLLVGVREGLRALVIHNSGGPSPDPMVTAPLREVSESSRVEVVVDGRGRVSLVPEGDSVAARLTSLLLIVKDAQLDGTWTHLKSCANDACEWAFYDRSRNHGGTWCDMASCGNKLKNRDFRARKRRAP
jgi:predicted RNA-binding Zn ribbon-like protein